MPRRRLREQPIKGTIPTVVIGFEIWRILLETTNPLRDEALVHADALDQLLQRANQFRLLRPAEELELAQRIERGDLVAKERLINCNLRLVVSIARRRRV